MMRTLDIKVNGNVIGGRQGWAYICNSMRFAVLKVDLDKEQEYDDFKMFGNVRVVWNFRGHENCAVGKLECSKGKWQIGGYGAMLKADFGFHDMMDSIEESNLPIIRKDDVIAIAFFSKHFETATLNLYRMGKVDIQCQTMANLIPLTDEEMQEIKNDAERWCMR